MKTLSLDVTDFTKSTVIDVKEMLQERLGVKVINQTLIHDGFKLPDEFKLRDCKVTEGSELELIVSAHCKSVPLSVIVCSCSLQICISCVCRSSCCIRVCVCVCVCVRVHEWVRMILVCLIFSHRVLFCSPTFEIITYVA